MSAIIWFRCEMQLTIYLIRRYAAVAASEMSKSGLGIEEYAKRTQFYIVDIPEKLLNLARGGNWATFLDAGCGDGVLLNAMENSGLLRDKEVFAVDLSETRISRVREINRKYRCFVEDVCDMKSIPDSSIDLLASQMVIEHVASDEEMTSELYRVLRPGGNIYLTTVFKKSFAWYRYRNNGQWVLDPTHAREYNDDSQLIDLLRKAGFEIIASIKTGIAYPLTDLLLRRIRADQKAYSSRFLRIARRLRIPILGYYSWEILASKPSN